MALLGDAQLGQAQQGRSLAVLVLAQHSKGKAPLGNAWRSNGCAEQSKAQHSKGNALRCQARLGKGSA